VLKPDVLAPAFDSSFIVPLAWSGKAGFKKVVGRKRRESVSQKALTANDTADCGSEVIVGETIRGAAKMGESADVAIKEGDLVTTIIQPDEIIAGVHQPHQELPYFAQCPCSFDRDFEEVYLSRLRRSVDERDENFGCLSAFLAKVDADSSDADIETFFAELVVEASASNALFWSGASVPLVEKLIKAWYYFVFDRGRPRRFFNPDWLRVSGILLDRSTAESHLPSHLANAFVFDEKFVSDDVNEIHPQHPRDPPAAIISRLKSYRK
jgi:hypothetical protein